MTEIVKMEAKETTRSETQDGAVVLGMIDRLIARPDVPVEKLEQLFTLHQKVQADAARRSYHAGLAAMQADLPTVAALGAIHGEDKSTGAKVKRSSYARWEDVNEAIRPAMTKHGFALSFRIDQPPDASRVSVTCVLSHRDGHSEETSLSLPNDPSGGKNNVQGWGSAISYGKRYTAFAMLNIAARGEDDDGQAGGTKPITDAQADELRSLITATATEIDKVLAFHKIESLSDMPAAEFQKAQAMLLARKAQQMKDKRNADR